MFFLSHRCSTRAVDHYHSHAERAQAKRKRSASASPYEQRACCLWHTFSSKAGRRGRFILSETRFTARTIGKYLFGTCFEFLAFELLAWSPKKFRKIGTFKKLSRNLTPKEIQFSVKACKVKNQATKGNMQFEIFGRNNYWA